MIEDHKNMSGQLRSSTSIPYLAKGCSLSVTDQLGYEMKPNYLLAVPH